MGKTHGHKATILKEELAFSSEPDGNRAMTEVYRVKCGRQSKLIWHDLGQHQ